MTDTCVIQYATGKCLEYLDLTKDIHQKFCKKHKYDYIVKTINNASNNLHVSWNKPLLIKEVCQKEYKKIIWLDADTIWLGSSLFFESKKPFSCTFHFCPINGGFHFNNGVILINNNEYTKTKVNEWLTIPDDNHVWAEQWSFNKMIHKNPTSINILDHSWNSVEHSSDHKSSSPRIVAWHGRPDITLHEMKRYLLSQEIGG